MSWFLIMTFAIATGSFIVAGAAVILVMSFANALAHSNIRTPGRHSVGAGHRPPP